jgi:hypothetical protein
MTVQVGQNYLIFNKLGRRMDLEHTEPFLSNLLPKFIPQQTQIHSFEVQCRK